MKESKKILIVSPAFPPAVNGLGDYSAILGNSLAKFNDIHVIYAGLPQNVPVKVESYYEINKTNTLSKIVMENKTDIIFLNYANYGYQKKGIPFWLLKQLYAIKGKIKIHVFFHELNATSHKPWNLVFWLKPIQIYIYKKIAKISDFIYCSNDIVYNILQKNFSVKLFKPGIFANLPEPVYTLKPLAQRKNIAVIFGSYGRRKSIYQQYPYLNNFIQQNNIEEIIDIGPGDIYQTARPIIIPVIQKGVLDGMDIAKILTDTKYGFICYPKSMFGKSGIFAAYAAYGLFIYNVYNSSDVETENLKEGIHYLSAIKKQKQELPFEIISSNILAWYEPRNTSNHMRLIYNKVKDSMK